MIDKFYETNVLSIADEDRQRQVLNEDFFMIIIRTQLSNFNLLLITPKS